MPKKTVIQVGDSVRIVRSRFIARVGYPLHFRELTPEFENHPQLEAALRMLGVMGPENVCKGRAKRDAVEGLARAAVRFRGWGGKQRQIHYFPTADPDKTFDFQKCRPDYTGETTTVISKRICMTGEYYAPSGGYDEYIGDYDFDPGGLSNRKSHVILTTYLGDIEACDVEKVS